MIDNNKKHNSYEVEMQRQYYAKTADKYDKMHLGKDNHDEHYLALSVLSGLIQYYKCTSVLDVGAGTGRTILTLTERNPGILLKGIEPVSELREEAYKKGIEPEILIDGNAEKLDFSDAAFDIVCCFGVLHHIKRPEYAVKEIIRVSKKMIFISDSNNFGQGHFLMRTMKQMLNSAHLWSLVNLIKTKGLGYTVSEGDGLAYSYSVFQNYNILKDNCETIHMFNTMDTKSKNLYRGAPHVVLAGIKPGFGYS